MKKMRTTLVAGFCVLWALDSSAEEEEPEIEQGEIMVQEPLIGLAAFDEVLASGRYLIGPQDEFLIYVTGLREPVVNQVLAEGGLFIPMVGTVEVGGLRLSEAHQKIEEEFRKTIKVGEIDVQLSKPRSFPVPVLGLIRTPGTRQGSAVQRVSQMVPKIEQLLSAASRRNIRVFKTRSMTPQVKSLIHSSVRRSDWAALQSMPSQRVDLVLYETIGDSKYNPFIEDGDVVVIPPQVGKVGAFEAVNRPDFYEFVEGDRISDLLMLALGPAPDHDPDNTILFRYGEDNTTMHEIEVDLRAALNGDEAADLALEPGDHLILRGYPGFLERSTIEISGEVKTPGMYVVDKSGTPLKSMIELAGGFTVDATLQEARVIRLRLEEEGRQIQDREFDRIFAIPAADRTEEDNQYFKMRVRERPGQMVVDFVALFEKGDESQNVRLQAGDVVVIPRKPKTVMVSGRAASPGAVIYNPDYGVSDYIDQAGGFGWRASKEVRVIKASTGEIQRAQNVEQVERGDRIWIKEKPERNYWSLFTQSMAVIGQVTTIVLLYVTITK